MFAHLIRDGPVEVGEDLVSGRYCHGHMEPDVTGDGLLDVARMGGCLSLFQKGFHFDDVFAGAEEGGFFGDLYFKELSDLVQVARVGAAQSLG